MLGLATTTDPRWIEVALADLDAVLLDHLHCELKAASNATAMVTRYPMHPRLVIELTELATSGYQWAVEAAPPGAVVTFERPSMDASAAPGAAAKTIARVRIDSPAAGTLVLAHRQPWSPDAPSNRLRLHLVRRG